MFGNQDTGEGISVSAANGRVTYSYVPETWNQDEFIRLGGFTVVFLNYNKTSMIERSVRSALNQDFPLLEMFFMDDASSDDSGDRMEAIVRSYRGRHKVAVVRNIQNQYITGQWNIVARLATGNWLGMFCADDVAHVDRVTLVAQRISKYQTLKGIATAAIDIDPGTGVALPDSHYVRAPYLASGDLTAEEILGDFKSNGSTSFWHKSLFHDSLPRAPLDDTYLHLILFAKNRGVSEPVFFYDSSIKTIDYTCGAGVCAQGIVASEAAGSGMRQWCLNQLRYKRFLRISAKTFELGIAYAQRQGLDATYNDPFRREVLWKYLCAGATWNRIMLLPRIVEFLIRGRDSAEKKFKLARDYVYFFLLEFFGLHVAACIRYVFRQRW